MSYGIEEKIDSFMRNTIIRTIFVTEKDNCERLVVETELLCALEQLKNGSAPGCDGITVEFLKRSWHALVNCWLCRLTLHLKIAIIIIYHQKSCYH